MPGDRNRREILGGDLYVAPAPSPSHQRAVVNLTLRLGLGNYLGTRGSGGLYCSPIDVVLSDTDVVQPDLVFVSAGRMHIVTSTAIQGVPDLVIEVLSPSTERVDRGRKMQTYARAGVREYWIADPEVRPSAFVRGVMIWVERDQPQKVAVPVRNGAHFLTQAE